jgi:hypothetical protein
MIFAEPKWYRAALIDERYAHVIVLYPEALNQHPGDAVDVLRTFLEFGIPIGLVAYLFSLLVLLVGTLTQKRRTTFERHTVQAALRAAVPIAAAFALFPLMLGGAEMTGGAVALSMVIATFAAAVILARFIMRRCIFLNVSRPFSDAWWGLILAVPILIGMAASISSAYENQEVARREKTADGIVTAYEPSNFNLCIFTFEFLGHTFEGAGRPPSGTTTVGQRVTVFFDTNDPQTNSLEDFSSASRRQLGMVPFCLLAICLVIGAVVYARRRQLRSANHILNA